MLVTLSVVMWMAAAGLLSGVAPATKRVDPPLATTVEGMHAELRAIAGHGSGVTVASIGRSVEGKDLLVARIRGADARADERRPTLAVVAGLDGRHVVGSGIALGIVKKVVAERPGALAHADLVVLVCANPDGMTRFEESFPRLDAGGNNAKRSTAREDADRDRRIDEDGPLDLNGDGLVTQMRVKRPRPGLVRDLAATDVMEPDEPRLMRRADSAKGEQPVYALLMEGRDQDGDGQIAEDGEAGVDLDSNFPYHWPEFDGVAGPTPLSEPETKAIADWLLAKPEVVAVLVYGPNDNLVSVPVGGKMDETGNAPISGSALDADKPLYEAAAKVFKETTGIGGVGGVTKSFDGSLVGWAYAQLGVAAFITPGWVRPDLVKKPEVNAAEKLNAGEKDPPTSPVAEPKDKPPESAEKKTEKTGLDTEEAKWLAFSDKQAEAARGFVAWSEFDHPQLGPVEIGGWAAGVRLNPPTGGWAAMQEEAIVAQTKFVGALLAGLPRLASDTPRVERLGERVWRIGVSATNTGTTPTRTAMGVKARRWPLTRWEIGVEAARRVSGNRVQGVAAVSAGGSVGAEWVVVGDAGSEVSVRLLSPECGDQAVGVRLVETAGSEEKK